MDGARKKWKEVTFHSCLILPELSLPLIKRRKMRNGWKRWKKTKKFSHLAIIVSSIHKANKNKKWLESMKEELASKKLEERRKR